MEYLRAHATTGICAAGGRLAVLVFVLFAVLAAGGCPAVVAATGTELGSEDDLTVLGMDGTADDPDAEIKGFTVFGSTQPAYTGTLAGPGNVVVNGVLAVSSGAYFVGTSTFAGAGKIFIGDGSAGQILRKNAAGYLDWDSVATLGDNLGDHTGAQVLQMGAYGVNTSSSITAARYEINGSTMLVILPGVESIAVGPNIAAHNSGNYNVFVGSGAASANTIGAQDTFIGHSAGHTNTTGAQNTFVGYASGYMNSGGWYNTFLGVNAGYNSVSGQYNTFLGDGAGLGNTTGSDNLYLGYYAGSNGQTGAGNIVIGSNQTLSAAAANNELNLGGVLYGDLTARTIGISTRVPQAALDVVSTGTTVNDYAQIWRASDGTIVSSMTATGVLYGTVAAGDNLGDHTATTQLKMGDYAIYSSSAITAAYYQINGSTVLALSGGTANPLSSISLGSDAGVVNVANFNVFIGSMTGTANTIGASNTMIGAGAGKMNVNGGGNIFMGRNSGGSNVSGSNNIYVGNTAGFYSQTGSANVALGTLAGLGASGSSFSSSTLVGYQAGYGLTTGSDNILLGWQAGYGLTTGARNIVIGYAQEASAPGASGELNIGGLLYGDLAAGTMGISTRAPQAALDIVSTGTAHTEMAQLWRASDGVIKASMSATGVMMAIKFIGDGSGITGLPGGDNLGNHTAAQALNMSNKAVDSVSSMTITGAGVTGSNPLFKVAGSTIAVLNNGNVGIGTTAPSQKLYVLGGKIGLDGGQQIVFSDADTSNNLKLQLWGGYGLGINGSTLFYAANGNHSWRDSGGTNERMLLTTAANGGLTVKGTGYSSFAGSVGIGTTSPQGKLDMSNNTIVNVADPINNQDAVNKQWVLANAGRVQYVGLTGGYNGNLGGAYGANAKCNAVYSGSHMCRQSELIAAGLTALASEVWIMPEIHSGTVSYLVIGATTDNCCAGWSYGGTSFYAPKLTTSGSVGQGRCDQGYPLPCCR